MLVRITQDLQAVIRSAHLCFAATVSPEGRPNVSPKGTIRVWDDHSLFLLNIASPKRRTNLAANPWMELNVVDQLSRRGYHLFGSATIHMSGEVFTKAIAMIAAEEGTELAANSIVLFELEETAPQVSTGHWHESQKRGGAQ